MNKEAYQNWRRREEGDKPRLLFELYPDGSRVEIPQVVGFENEKGTPIEISKKMAEKLGLVTIGEIKAVSMPVKDWIELQEKKREEGRKRWEETEWETGTGLPKFPPQK